MVIRESMELGGAEFSLETGKLAKQAHGSVVVRHGDSMVLATCVGEEEYDPAKPFFPLTVDYRENFYAAGRFPGGFFKREGRSSAKETLTCRLIDRPMRPMFTEGYMGEVQVNCMVISSDGVYETDVCAMVGGMAAAYLSPVPFPQALAAVRVGLVDDELVVNPNTEQKESPKPSRIERKRTDLDVKPEPKQPVAAPAAKAGVAADNAAEKKPADPQAAAKSAPVETKAPPQPKAEPQPKADPKPPQTAAPDSPDWEEGEGDGDTDSGGGKKLSKAERRRMRREKKR